MSDLELDFEFPEMPTASAEEASAVINDKFESAVKFSFVGVGHGGSRIASAFYQLGYHRVVAVNTAMQDLQDLDLPPKRKMYIGGDGAAKNRKVGNEIARKQYEGIIESMRIGFGAQFDRIMVCATAGGGTGSGGFEAVVDAAIDLTESLRVCQVGDPTRVGLILALPSNSERDRMANACEALKVAERYLAEKKVSPIILVDNERIRAIFRTATLGDVWSKTNRSIAQMFHLFNRLSVTPSAKYTAFDPADYRQMLDGGLMTFGAMDIKIGDKDEIAKAVRENLQNNVLSGGTDLRGAAAAACLLVGEDAVLSETPVENVNYAYETLCRVIGGGTVHQGIYAAARPLSAYTLISGLALPEGRCNEMARLAGFKDWASAK